MAGKTNTEKIDDLYRLVYTLVAQVEVIRNEVNDLVERRPRVDVLQHQVADLKKSHDSLITRLWMVGVPLVVAVFGALITALVRK